MDKPLIHPSGEEKDDLMEEMEQVQPFCELVSIFFYSCCDYLSSIDFCYE